VLLDQQRPIPIARQANRLIPGLEKVQMASEPREEVVRKLEAEAVSELEK
jgi:hypothetical protein